MSRLFACAALAALWFGPAAAQAPSFQLEGGHLVVPEPVVFVAGTADLAPESKAALEHVVAYLNDKTYITLLRVEGHTGAGDAVANQKLSEQRALAVTRALIDRGIECTRLLPVGFGQEKPVAPNDTPENRARNQRTAFVNAALRGKPIGGMPVDGGGRVAGDPCAKR